jgi:hypothetical protein
MPALAAPPVSIKIRPLSELAIHPQREASAQVVSLNLAKLASEPLLLVATTLTLFTMPILLRLAMQIGPVLRGGVSRRLRRAPAA